MPKYVPVHETSFREMIEGAMGFQPTAIPGTSELVWERPVSKYTTMRIYSTITRNGTSRGVGEDAIRICLVSNSDNRAHVVASERVYRTKNALETMRRKARELWSYALHHKCQCGHVMVERTGKNGRFYGCSNFPVCRNTKEAS